MEKRKFTEETDKAVMDAINKKILRHTIQFFKKGKKRLQPYGTGVFAKIHEKYFIITASHVADFFENNPNESLHIRVGKDLFVNVIGDIQYTDIDKSGGVDLAYIKLDTEIIPALLKPYIPLEIEKIRAHHNLLHAMNYCVLGFPEKNQTKQEEKLDTGASFYLVGASKEKPYNHYKYDKKDYIIVDIQGKGVDIKTNSKTKIDTRFHGLSGCGLWLLLIHKPENGETQIDYRLVGIMTEYKQGKFFCLVANKIHLIIEAFKVIEKFKFNEIIIKPFF